MATDLNSITVDDFKAHFRRDFLYLPVYDNATLYNSGDRVYYETTRLFYDCTVNGTQGITPDTPSNWTQVADNIDDYVLDEDITKAFSEAKPNINVTLFSSEEACTLAYLYLVAHYLVIDLRNSEAGLDSATQYPVTSRSAGSVSESYGLPEYVTKDRDLYYFTLTGYGTKYLSLVLPLLRGNVHVVAGATSP